MTGSLNKCIYVFAFFAGCLKPFFDTTALIMLKTVKDLLFFDIKIDAECPSVSAHIYCTFAHH
jgi:hypothetical protein